MADHHYDATGFWRGIRLFNAGEFFAAHEALEDVWREAPREQRPFLQGLIQIAVALHHHRNGNLAGATSLLARGERNLSGYADLHGGIDLARLRQEIAAWREALARQLSPPPLPQVVASDAKMPRL